MKTAARVIAAIPGLLFLLNGLGWIFDPTSAAQGLGLPLLDGVARSTQIGDLGAFFIAGATMILFGAATARPVWLHAAALLVGGAAVMRTLAWLLHGAALATTFIAIEVVITAVLLFAASKLSENN